MEFAEFAYRFFVECRCMGCLVEIQVSAKQFIRTSPDSTILIPILLITRASKYMGVLARTVVTS
jgi:hypothetical protein